MAQYFTQEGLEKLKKDLKHLETVKRREVAEKLRHAVSFGDVSENAAYDDAKEAQGVLEGKISRLKGILATAKIAEKNGKKEIQVGSVVVVCSNNKKEEYQIVGPEEADVLKGKISYQSPLGKNLLGKERGDSITLKTPSSAIEYEIKDVK
ncbi:MAG: transcription elongation factor GreA [Candidatus Pacebacteria bacterium]|nr:transcription elongation factor GreA [Candidatus Paceibacterota bacterium]